MIYECVICLSINHATKLHCSICGTIPAHYSPLAKPARQVEMSHYVEVRAAIGCIRVCQRRARRMNLFTVPAGYYAEV